MATSNSRRYRSASAHHPPDPQRAYAYDSNSSELSDLATPKNRVRLTTRSAGSLANATIPEETSTDLEGSNSSRQDNGSAKRVFFKSEGSLRFLVWIVKLVMLTAVLICLVFSKLTLVQITGTLYRLQNTTDKTPVKESLPYYWMLFLAVMIPDVLTWFYTLFTGILMNRTTHPWPSRRSLILVSETGSKGTRCKPRTACFHGLRLVTVSSVCVLAVRCTPAETMCSCFRNALATSSLYIVTRNVNSVLPKRT